MVDFTQLEIMSYAAKWYIEQLDNNIWHDVMCLKVTQISESLGQDICRYSVHFFSSLVIKTMKIW